MNPDSKPALGEIVKALRALSRTYGDMDRFEALRKLAEDVFVDGERTADRMEGLLADVLSALPPAYGRAAHAMFWPSSRKLRSRQEEAAAALGYSWESFRKRYLETFMFEFADRLVATASRPVVPIDEPLVDAADNMRLASELTASATEAVLLIGNLLLVKTGGRVTGVTLTPDELSELNGRRSELLVDPEAALAFLQRDR